MKFVLAVFVALVFVSNSVLAATGKEVVIITSNPQPANSDVCVLPNCDSSKIIPNIEAQYQWINQKIDRTNLLGVVVNGNWTGSGVDMFAAEKLYEKLEVPLYFGLGANDYTDNRTSAPGDAILAVEMLHKQIKKIKDPSQYNKKVHFDFVTGEQSSQKVGAGSLGYAVELGKEKNVYLIQLNNNGTPNSTQFVLNGRRKNGSVTNFTYNINSPDVWLETRLEYAAKTGKKIIFTKNGPDVDQDVLDLLDAYNVKMRFLGAKPDSPLCLSDEFICLGFSTEKELLKLELDYDSGKFNVSKLKAGTNENIPVADGALVIHPPLLPKHEYPVQKQTVIFRNPGWYNGFPSVTYKNTINGPDQDFAGSRREYAMKLNDIFLVDVPIEITWASQATGKLTASYIYSPGNWDILTSDQKLVDVAVVCIISRGTAGLGWAEVHKSIKMGEGGEVEMLNECP